MTDDGEQQSWCQDQPHMLAPVPVPSTVDGWSPNMAHICHLQYYHPLTYVFQDSLAGICGSCIISTLV